MGALAAPLNIRLHFLADVNPQLSGKNLQEVDCFFSGLQFRSPVHFTFLPTLPSGSGDDDESTSANRASSVISAEMLTSYQNCGVWILQLSMLRSCLRCQSSAQASFRAVDADVTGSGRYFALRSEAGSAKQ
uniref:Uncharacterized protein n=1 Tax=Mycena chlorophos TaxID=658473 RepID=A0ABQ0LBB3_MYCCL|nr:predicted protein [Mycena chlorophos]